MPHLWGCDTLPIDASPVRLRYITYWCLTCDAAIHYLLMPHRWGCDTLPIDVIHYTLLQVSLRSNKIQFLTDFAQNGLKRLLSILNECYRRFVLESIFNFLRFRSYYAKQTIILKMYSLLNNCAVFVSIYSGKDRQWDAIQHEAIKCLREICNNIAGIKQFFKQCEAFTLLAHSLNPSKPAIMLEVSARPSRYWLLPWTPPSPPSCSRSVRGLHFTGSQNPSKPAIMPEGS